MVEVGLWVSQRHALGSAVPHWCVWLACSGSVANSELINRNGDTLGHDASASLRKEVCQKVVAKQFQVDMCRVVRASPRHGLHKFHDHGALSGDE